MKKLEWMERGRGGYEARVGAVWLTVAYVDRARGIQPTMGFRLADAVDWKPPGDDDFDTCKPKAIALARSRIAGAVAELREADAVLAAAEATPGLDRLKAEGEMLEAAGWWRVDADSWLRHGADVVPHDSAVEIQRSASRLLVWWLSEEEVHSICRTAAIRRPVAWPEYMTNEFVSMQGRVGRGRLWVAPQFGAVKLNVEERQWAYTPIGMAASCRGGIVILPEDVKVLADMPGLITDLSLVRHLGGGS